MEESFFFALLRISVAQILKASGFDKCKPLVLNAVTDLYIKHLQLVLSSAKKFSQARTNCTNKMGAEDLVQALLDVQLIKPLSFESVLDPHDSAKPPQLEYNTKSLESFVKWLKYSDSYRLSKRLSEVPTPLIRNLIEKRKIDTSTETDQDRKKRRLKERQEYYNQLKQGEESTQRMDGFNAVEDFEEDEITSNDKLTWLSYLAEKDLKLGHNLKFLNTCIQDSLMDIQKNSKYHPTSKDSEGGYQSFQDHVHNLNKNDHILIHIQEAEELEEGMTTIIPSAQLKSALPYNIRYNDALVSDDLDQYLDYAEKHGDLILNGFSKARNGQLETVLTDGFESGLADALESALSGDVQNIDKEDEDIVEEALSEVDDHLDAATAAEAKEDGDDKNEPSATEEIEDDKSPEVEVEDSNVETGQTEELPKKAIDSKEEPAAVGEEADSIELNSGEDIAGEPELADDDTEVPALANDDAEVAEKPDASEETSPALNTPEQ